MLPKIKSNFSSRSKINLTPGEAIRDAMIKAATEGAYAAGNSTDKWVGIADEVGKRIDFGTQLVSGGEASTAIGKIIYKTTRDVSRGDTICTGLCVVSGVCETLALGCSTLKKLPLRGKIYIGAKMVSRGCMAYRNRCAGEGC